VRTFGHARCLENVGLASGNHGRAQIYGKKDSRYDACLVVAVPLESDECRVSAPPSVCVARRCAIAGEGQLASSREEMTESVVRVTSSRCSNDGNELNSANCSLNSSLGATTSRRVYYNDREDQTVSAISGQSKNGFGGLRRCVRGD